MNIFKYSIQNQDFWWSERDPAMTLWHSPIPKNRWPILQQKSTIWIMDTWETNGFYMVCKSWKGWNMPHFVDDWPLQEMVMFQFANCEMTRGRAPIFLGFPLGIAIISYNITISITILPHVSCFFPTSMVKTNGELPPWSPLLGRYASIVPASAAQLRKKAEGNPWKTLGPLFENIPSGYD